jgi:hypothetical protein
MRSQVEPPSVRAMRLYAAEWIKCLDEMGQQKFLPDYSEIMQQQRLAETKQQWLEVHSRWNWFVESIRIYLQDSP